MTKTTFPGTCVTQNCERPVRVKCRQLCATCYERQSKLGVFKAAPFRRIHNDGTVKKCGRCLEIKPLEDFGFNKSTNDGYQSYCRICKSAVDRARKPNNGKKRRDRLRTYGLTPEDYEALLENQNSVCAICKKPEKARDRWSSQARNLAVDHDHWTGQVRGLLCHSCNSGLGKFSDDPELLLSAIEFLASPPAVAVLAARNGIHIDE